MNKFSLEFDYGYASALAWIMLVIITVVTALLFWSRSKWVYDD